MREKFECDTGKETVKGGDTDGTKKAGLTRVTSWLCAERGFDALGITASRGEVRGSRHQVGLPQIWIV